MVFQEGSIPLNTISKNIKYSFYQFNTPSGLCSIKSWFHFDENLYSTKICSSPKKTKYKKTFKQKIKGQTSRGSKIIYGSYALKTIEHGRLTARQIEAARRAIMKKMKKLGFLWIRVFPDTPVTSKPTENRMGKGKGAVSFWVSRIQKGQILYEIGGIPFEEAKKAFQSGSNKLPFSTKIVKQ